MEHEQLNAIAGLIAGLQTSITVLSEELERRGVLSTHELSARFAAAAQDLPETLVNRDLIGLALYQVSASLVKFFPAPPDSSFPDLPPPDPSRPYLRVIRGGKE